MGVFVTQCPRESEGTVSLDALSEKGSVETITLSPSQRELRFDQTAV